MKIENVSIMDLDYSIKASKYPMTVDTNKCNFDITNTVIGLASSEKGCGHDQFLTGIRAAFDLTCSNKMWVELERYRFVEFVSSQSTMHRITKLDIRKQCNKYVWGSTIDKLQEKVNLYNEYCEKIKKLGNASTEYKGLHDKMEELYLEILYNVPSGFELTARLTTNYRALKTVYSQRKNHKLPEWREFCQWIETLPLFKELVLGEGVNE